MAAASLSPPSSPSSSSIPSSATAAAADTFKRLHPEAYLGHFVEADVRPDGRSRLGFRDTIVSVGAISSANGSALVRLGSTCCVAGVKALYANPPLTDERGVSGWLVPNVTISPMASGSVRPGPPPRQAQTLTAWLHDTLKNCKSVDLDLLCIVPKQLVWAIYLDIEVINADGNLADACLLAACAALRDTRLPLLAPGAVAEGGAGGGGGGEAAPPLASRHLTEPLPLGTLPLSASFGVFRGHYLMADLSADEAQLAGASTTVVLDHEGMLRGLHCPAPGATLASLGSGGGGGGGGGGGAVAAEPSAVASGQLADCTSRAEARVRHLYSLLDTAMAEGAKKKKITGGERE